MSLIALLLLAGRTVLFVRLLCARTVLLTSVLLWLPLAFAQPAPTGPGIEAAYTALDAASEREARVIEVRDRAFAAAQAKELAARSAADGEIRTRRKQVADLQRIEQEIVGLLDRIQAAGTRPQQLLVEQAVLKDWYQDLQPAMAHLTERSFRGAEVELDVLAGSGMIEPGQRRFRSYLELRNRLAEVGRRLAEHHAEAQRSAAALRTQVEALAERRKRALAQLARADPAVARAAEDWQAATRELERHSAALVEARNGLERATRDVLDAAGRLRPPVLAEVAASVDGQTIYSAAWRRADGTSATEREREAKRDALTQARSKAVAEIEELTVEQRQRSEVRSEAAERMHRLSGYLQRSADRYAADRMFQARTALAVDIGLTVAEIALTGGSATLARKATVAAQAAAQAVESAAARRAAVGAVSPLEAAVVQRFSRQGEPIVDNLRRAAQSGRAALETEAAAMTNKLVREGLAKEAAEKQAKAMYQPIIARLDLIERSNRLANEIRAGALTPGGASYALPALIDALHAGGEEAGFKSVEAGQSLYQFVKPGASPTAAPHIDSMKSTAIGEGIELGLNVLANTYQAAPDQAASALGKAATLGSKFKNGITANGFKLGVGVVSSAYEIAVASQLDAIVNAEADNFAKLMAELNYSYAMYQAQLAADRELDAYIGQLRGVQAGINGAIKLLDSGLQLSSKPTQAEVSPDGTLRLELTFSAPLAAAPMVTVGAVAVAMQRKDASGLRWLGTIAVNRVGRGAQPVSVAASDAATSYGALDSDPSTPAIRLSRRAGWKGFEAGADARHVIPLGLAKPPEQPVEPAKKTPPPTAIQASELAGLWTGSGYTCNGREPDQSIEITYSAEQGLIARKVRGDDCIHSSEITWRGRLDGQTIQGEIHLRARNAAANSDSWRAASWQVISRNEIRGFGVTYHRGSTAAGTCRGFAGEWAGWMGPVHLQVAGSAVTGRYGNNNIGTISGTISGDVLTGRAFQSGVRDSYGSIRLQLSADGKAFSGRWTQDPANGNRSGDFSARCKDR